MKSEEVRPSLLGPIRLGTQGQNMAKTDMPYTTILSIELHRSVVHRMLQITEEIVDSGCRGLSIIESFRLHPSNITL